MFTKVQVYCKKKDCCFDDIKNSRKPYVLINTDQICSLGPKTDWGFCTGHSDYPFRVLDMKNGDTFLLVLESAKELEELLLHGIGNEKQEWSDDDKNQLHLIKANLEYLRDNCKDYRSDADQAYLNKQIDWLKSIRPQPQQVVIDLKGLGNLARHLIAAHTHDIKPKYEGRELELLERIGYPEQFKAQKGESV